MKNTADRGPFLSLTKTMVERIISSINWAMAERNWSQGEMIRRVKSQDDLDINPGNFSSYLGGKVRMPLCVIISCCKILDLSIVEAAYSDDVANLTFNQFKEENGHSNLTVDANDVVFEKQCGHYHCYFLPTKNGESEMLKAELTISNEGSVCRARFSLNVRAIDGGDFVKKDYTGFLIVSRSLNMCYIMLFSDFLGEFCSLSYRYFSPSTQDLDCRIAFAMTTSAGSKHYPTVHRMIISKEEIKDEDLASITPYLHMTSSMIRIEKEKLDIVKESSDEYAKALRGFTVNLPHPEMYSFPESLVTSWHKATSGNFDVDGLLHELRIVSLADDHMKIGNSADDRLHVLLQRLGYFRHGAIG